jgi:hypothetical protein
MVCNVELPLKKSLPFTILCEGDHIFGLLPLLASRLNGAGGMADGVDDPRAKGLFNQDVSHPILSDNVNSSSFSLLRFTDH